MFGDKKVLGIIPARGGSKGLPGKNIIKTNDRPLIGWTIEMAKKSNYIDRLVVSTDDEKIAEVSKSEGAEIPFIRPDELATDTAKTTDVVIDLINKLEKLGDEYDIIVLLEPTSPLRKPNDIDSTIEAITKDGKFDGAITLGKYKTHPQLAKEVDENGLVESKAYNSENRRQDLKEFYFPFGVAYVVKTNAFKREKSFYPKKLGYYVIEDWQCHEIDDYWDWVCVEAIMKKVRHFS